MIFFVSSECGSNPQCLRAVQNNERVPNASQLNSTIQSQEPKQPCQTHYSEESYDNSEVTQVFTFAS